MLQEDRAPCCMLYSARDANVACLRCTGCGELVGLLRLLSVVQAKEVVEARTRGGRPLLLL